jgi:biopolymer transport protein ExbB/TolQ
MGWLDRADLSLLALMLANTGVIIWHRIRRYRQATRQTRAFVRETAVARCEGSFQKVAAISARNSRSHVAAVVAATLTAWASTPPELADVEAIDSALRASQRSRRMVSAELRLGLGSLATTASCAPFIGLLGTVFGILNAFGGIAMAKSAVMALIASNLAEALLTAALGLLVAILATWSHSYFCARVETFENGMLNAALELATYLRRHRQCRRQFEHSAAAVGRSLLGQPQAAPAHSWEVPYDHQRALMVWIWFSALSLAWLCARGMDWSCRRQRSQDGSSAAWQQVGGQEAISPDRRYRAMVPVFYRSWEHLNGESHWSCGSTPRVTLVIVPNDRPRAWRSHLCGQQTRYALEPDAALLARNCSVPAIMWRTYNELLVQCSGCSVDNLQRMRLDFFPHEITVLGGDGKRIPPRLLRSPPPCLD